MDFLSNQLLDPFDVFLILPIEIAPQVFQWSNILRVGNVLIVSPHGVEAFTQLMD